ncbi:MAG TPA: hypothetical protein VGL22_05725 [Terracidiphilus sp.]|jgi:hypothetical protein
MRSIRAARETFAAVALTGLTVATAFRCVAGIPGAIGGVILTVMALAILSRFRVCWDDESVTMRTPFSLRRRRWANISSYSLEPEPRDIFELDRESSRRRFAFLEPCGLRLHGREGELALNLKPYSWQDIRHLQNRVSTEVPVRDRAGVLVS